MPSPLIKILSWGRAKDNTCALVVIQGLGGRIHNPLQPDTQGAHIIQWLMNDYPELPIYGASYPSQLEDFKTDTSLTSKRIIQQLADTLFQVLLQRHEHLICIGYCLGGYYLSKTLPLLEKAFTFNHKTLPHPFDRLSLLFLDAPHTITPQGLTPWFQGILDILRIAPAELTANQAYWEKAWKMYPDFQLWQRTAAIVSSQESWVSPLGPDIGLPEPRVQVVASEHDDLLLPPKKGKGEVYEAIKRFVGEQWGNH
ncbi:MAG TPA: hypothetical protein DCE41_13615 [Cytophagales bacterium]|nr:hypothetical protein [Cytophagales bacterium]HAA17720.1 hypothetical protein [Cytophagales bacterium]HAP60014.1 hypothetical protein [Cytophagales bacterium]